MTGGRPQLEAEVQNVFGSLTHAAVFLIVTINPGGEDEAKQLLANVTGLERTVGSRSLGGALSCVAGVSASAWDRLYGDPKPAELRDLPVFAGEKHQSVTTDGDLMFHIRAERMDLCFELATLIMHELAGAVAIVDEVQGFRYFDGRDVLGFVDGTENPVGAEAYAATLVDDDEAFNGGSYVIVQKYLHDMAGWNGLTTEAQEHAIGRRKLSNVELAEGVQPDNSHVALTQVTDTDGTELKILRDNMPFGRPGYGEFGTYFIGYAKSPSVVERMLENMFVGAPPGNYDRILDYSTPVTGVLFYCPTVDFVEQD